VSDQSDSAAAAPQKKKPSILIWRRARWVLNPVWTLQRSCKSVVRAGNWNPVAWSPYRLSYPGFYRKSSSEQCIVKWWSTYPKVLALTVATPATHALSLNIHFRNCIMSTTLVIVTSPWIKWAGSGLCCEVAQVGSWPGRRMSWGLLWVSSVPPVPRLGYTCFFSNPVQFIFTINSYIRRSILTASLNNTQTKHTESDSVSWIR
jgi:hypothetical protein